MADPIGTGESQEASPAEEAAAVTGAEGGVTRKEKRKTMKKLKRKQLRKEAAISEREEEATRSNDPEEQLRIRQREQEEAEAADRERRAFEERERLWLEAAAARKAAEDAAAAEDERRKKLLEEDKKHKMEADELEEDDAGEYIEEGPPEIIWQGNEIIIKKKRVKVVKKSDKRQLIKEDDKRPTSNPLPPQFALPPVSAQEVLEKVAQEVPNFGTEQDKAHCPFHLKTGACRFGSRCSRIHFYPDKSCTLLIKNMYNGPGLAWEQDEGLEYTDEEVDHCYEEFYEDVHTEFQKFGELVNFKVCKNGSSHLRGNVYVHYKSLDSAVLAYNSINGRYYGGKQITCEFVGVTRWKVAICGEFMKLRLKTCSHGSACNFIHCFRNPGGDYEWADWDNPPPRYWVKKMIALFGPSDESDYARLELEDSDKPTNFSRKKAPTSSGYHSRRSSNSKMGVHARSSSVEDSGSIKDRCGDRLTTRNHSKRKRNETASLARYEHSDGNGRIDKRSMHSQDFGNDSFKDGKFLDQREYQEYSDNYHQRHYRNHNLNEDLHSSRREKSYSREQMCTGRKHKSISYEQEYESSNRHTDSDDSRELSHSHSRENFHMISIDEERYSGGYDSGDMHLNEDSYCETSTEKNCGFHERGIYDHYKLQHQSSDKFDEPDNNGVNRRSRKQKSGNHRGSSRSSISDLEATSKGYDQIDHSENSPCRKSNRSFRKHYDSNRKRKNHQTES